MEANKRRITYEQALKNAKNVAHVRLFLHICNYVIDKDAKDNLTCEMNNKISLEASLLSLLLNDKTKNANKEETSILFDMMVANFMDREDLWWKIDYGIEGKFGEVYQEWMTKMNKIREESNVPKLPHGMLGVKKYFFSKDGHAHLERETINHHGFIIKCPWEKYFKTESESDRLYALELCPKIPYEAQIMFINRKIERNIHLSFADDFVLLFDEDDPKLKSTKHAYAKQLLDDLEPNSPLLENKIMKTLDYYYQWNLLETFIEKIPIENLKENIEWPHSSIIYVMCQSYARYKVIQEDVNKCNCKEKYDPFCDICRNKRVIKKENIAKIMNTILARTHIGILNNESYLKFFVELISKICSEDNQLIIKLETICKLLDIEQDNFVKQVVNYMSKNNMKNRCLSGKETK